MTKPCVYVVEPRPRTRTPHSMNRIIRTLSLGTAFVLGTAAFAQPLPPYDVTVAGYISGCNPLGTNYVNIQTQQGTQPALDIDVPVDGNCGFSVNLTMDSFQGWFLISTGCNGAIVSETVTYTVNALQPDSNYVYLVLNCGSNVPDCQGNPGGPALPGTECTIPGTALTGLWSINCECLPSIVGCSACFTIDSTQTEPWMVSFSNCSVGGAEPYSYFWTFDNGITSTPAAEPTIEFNSPGAFTACLTIFDANGCEDMVCDSFFVDVNGNIFQTPVVYDCMQVTNGPDMPGTPCTNPATGVSGTWSSLCECLPNVEPSCQASFFVLQAYENGDTTGTGVPVPNTLWVWNLSSGGSGAYQFLWSFGDGTSSNEAFPTHTYAGSGPYTLCLTISDSEGCTSTVCDTISVDDDGIYNGLIGSGGNRSALTVNVINPLALGLDEASLSTISLWPNPAREQLNIALDSRLDGAVNMEVIDLNGRVVMTQQERSVAGNNRFVLSTEGIPAGLYALRISNGSNTVTQRFVRD